MLPRNAWFRGEPQKNRFTGLLPDDSRLITLSESRVLRHQPRTVTSGLHQTVGGRDSSNSFGIVAPSYVFGARPPMLRSAGFQPAACWCRHGRQVSRISNPHAVETACVLGFAGGLPNGIRRYSATRTKPQPNLLDCGGKRSATPLWDYGLAFESGVAASLCHRSPKSSRLATIPEGKRDEPESDS